MRIDEEAPGRRTLSLTPLIDVVFLLLMFFMLASTFARFSVVEVALTGEGGAAASVPQARPVLLSVGPGSTFLVNGQPVSAKGIGEALVLVAEDESVPVIVRPSARARSQDIVTALEAARAAGVGTVALAR